MRKLQVLLLCDYRRDSAATTAEHIESLVKFSGHEVRAVSTVGALPRRLQLNRFDVVVVHYSLFLFSDQYVSSQAKAALRAFAGLKVVFIQDEYRNINATVDALQEIDADLLFTCVPDEEIEKVYSPAHLPALKKVSTLTGYVSENLCKRDVPPFCSRPIDVGYRSRRVPAWLGALGQDKWRIGPRFLKDARRFGLNCDISNREEDRLYGEKWTGFLTRCKAVLGTEGGASVFDFDGTVRERVDAHIRRHPDASFEELQRLYFLSLEGKIRHNKITPRCFEAAALRTLMIMYPGEYSGILAPYRHYVLIEKDHSNMEEVVAILRDVSRCEEIIDSAYREVALNPGLTSRVFVEKFDQQVSDSWRAKAIPVALPYSLDEFRSNSRLGLTTRFGQWRSRSFVMVYRVIFGKILRFLSDEKKDRIKVVIRSGLTRVKGLLSLPDVS